MMRLYPGNARDSCNSTPNFWAVASNAAASFFGVFVGASVAALVTRRVASERTTVVTREGCILVFMIGRSFKPLIVAAVDGKASKWGVHQSVTHFAAAFGQLPERPGRDLPHRLDSQR